MKTKVMTLVMCVAVLLSMIGFSLRANAGSDVPDNMMMPAPTADLPRCNEGGWESSVKSGVSCQMELQPNMMYVLNAEISKDAGKGLKTSLVDCGRTYGEAVALFDKDQRFQQDLTQPKTLSGLSGVFFVRTDASISFGGCSLQFRAE